MGSCVNLNFHNHIRERVQTTLESCKIDDVVASDCVSLYFIKQVMQSDTAEQRKQVMKSLSSFTSIVSNKPMPDSISSMMNSLVDDPNFKKTEALVHGCQVLSSARKDAFKVMASHHEGIDTSTQNFAEQDESKLVNYSHASVITGSKPWMKQAFTRICEIIDDQLRLTDRGVDRYVKEYIARNMRSLRKKHFVDTGELLTDEEKSEVEDTLRNTVLNDPNKQFQGVCNVIDIGSCHNPFKELLPNNCEVFAMDLQPGVPGVYKADFLQIRPEGEFCFDGNVVTAMPQQHFNVAIMSLVMSYLPSSTHRSAIVQHARRFLKDDGLLCLLVAKSVANPKRFQGEILNRWTRGFESCGFDIVQTWDTSPKAGMIIILRRSARQPEIDDLDLFATLKEYAKITSNNEIIEFFKNQT